MTACGLWLARRRLVAVLVGDGGAARRTVRAALTDEARYELLEYLAHAGAEIVATSRWPGSTCSRPRPPGGGLVVWRADDAPVAALLRAPRSASARAAAVLARMPGIPLLRASLRRLVPPEAAARQLPLL